MRRNPSSSRTRTDLDLRAPGALAALFARNRAEFGGARMELDTATATAPAAGIPTPPATEPTADGSTRPPCRR